MTPPRGGTLGLAIAYGLAGTAAAAGCTYGDDIPAPMLSAVMPARVLPGESLTLLGEAFCQQPMMEEADPLTCANIGTVMFGTVPGNIDAYADTAITVETPAVAPGTVEVFVAVAGRHSNGLSIVVEAPARGPSTRSPSPRRRHATVTTTATASLRHRPSMHHRATPRAPPRPATRPCFGRIPRRPATRSATRRAPRAPREPRYHSCQILRSPTVTLLLSAGSSLRRRNLTACCIDATHPAPRRKWKRQFSGA